MRLHITLKSGKTLAPYVDDYDLTYDDDGLLLEKITLTQPDNHAHQVAYIDPFQVAAIVVERTASELDALRPALEPTMPTPAGEARVVEGEPRGFS